MAPGHRLLQRLCTLLLVMGGRACELSPSLFCDSIEEDLCIVSKSKLLDCATCNSTAPKNPTVDSVQQASLPVTQQRCSFNWTGSVFIGSGVNVSCTDPFACYLQLSAGKDLEVAALSAVSAATVDLTVGGDASLLEESLITSSGLGPLSGPGAPFLLGNGGSFGGSGGQTLCLDAQRSCQAQFLEAIFPSHLGVPVTACCDGASSFLSVNRTIGSYSRPPDDASWGSDGAGSGGFPAEFNVSALINTTDAPHFGRGGGRVRLTVSGTLTLDGSIAADGAPGGVIALIGTNATALVGGGSGGTIAITATLLTSTKALDRFHSSACDDDDDDNSGATAAASTFSASAVASSGRIHADGGIAVINGSYDDPYAASASAGGGGGRVYITVSNFDLSTGLVTAYGGIVPIPLSTTATERASFQPGATDKAGFSSSDALTSCLGGAAGSVWISESVSSIVEQSASPSPLPGPASPSTAPPQLDASSRVGFRDAVNATTFNRLIVSNSASSGSALATTLLRITAGDGPTIPPLSTFLAGSEDADVEDPVDSLYLVTGARVAADVLNLRTTLPSQLERFSRRLLQQRLARAYRLAERQRGRAGQPPLRWCPSAAAAALIDKLEGSISRRRLPLRARAADPRVMRLEAGRIVPITAFSPASLPFIGLSLSLSARLQPFTDEGLGRYSARRLAQALLAVAGGDTSACDASIAAASPWPSLRLPSSSHLSNSIPGRIPPRSPTGPFNITMTASEVLMQLGHVEVREAFGAILVLRCRLLLCLWGA